MVDPVKTKSNNGKNKSQSGRLIENSNVLLPDESDRSSGWGDSYASDVPKKKALGVPKNHEPSDLYCCICAKKHHEENCNMRRANKFD